MKFLIKIALTALAFAFLLPHIPGISFHGSFFIALLMAFFFGIMLWIVDVAAVALSAILAVSSFGAALLWLIPLWILGFWLLPAVALVTMSDLFPSYLSIHGWAAAALGGLALMLIGIFTSNIDEGTIKPA
jgi:hypothetical protein